jgi:allophanate hydrolase
MKLDIESLRAAYTAGKKPTEIVDAIFDRIGDTVNPVWISLVPRDAVLARARQVEEIGREKQALYGIPFAVKDNIDVAGIPTTAGCPAYAYTPAESATVVRLLEEAGAIVIGKTNLDQFATGLVGVRSPYGACSSVFDDRYISGGSSSGSAVAVASGLVTFALGTDTAGSGRVPAAFNNLIGLKPTRGALSTVSSPLAARSTACRSSP